MATVNAYACPYCSQEARPARPSIQACCKCRRPIVPALDPDTGVLEAWFPGDLGRYCLLEAVGRGGMGRVFRAQDKLTGKLVAVKFPREDLDSDPILRERFEREMRLLQSLDHPNVVRFLGEGDEAARRYYVMEWVEGTDLAKQLADCRARGQVLPFETFHGWFRQLCGALQALHDQGIVHRDVKPSNIMVSPDGRARLLDLGVAKNLAGPGATTQSCAALGTINYLAPEQEQTGAVVDHRADIFALGVVAYESLTGSLPRGNVRQPSTVNPTVSRWFDKTVMRMMERAPSARPSSIGPLGEMSPPSTRIRLWLRRIWRRSPTIADPILVPCPCCKHEVPVQTHKCMWCGHIFVSFSYATLVQKLSTVIVLVYWEVAVFGGLVYAFPQYVPTRAVIAGIDVPTRHVVLLTFGAGIPALMLIGGGIVAVRQAALAKRSVKCSGCDATIERRLRRCPHCRQAQWVQQFGEDKVGQLLGITIGCMPLVLCVPCVLFSVLGVAFDLSLGASFLVGIIGGIVLPFFLYHLSTLRHGSEVRLDVKNALFFVNRGVAWYGKREYDRAIKDYEEAIRLDPKNSLAFQNRGIAWYGKREYDKAIEDYDAAIRLDPKNSNAFVNRGNAWIQKGDHDRAIKDYEEAIRLAPMDSDAFNNRGIAWKAKGNLDRAIKDYEEAIRLDPKNSLAFQNRGIAWYGEREYDKAIEDYDAAIRLDPKNSNAFVNRGVAWAEKGDHDRAIKDYEEAIRIDPKNGEAFETRAIVWALKGNHDQAIKDIDRASELHPSDARLLELRQWIEHERKKAK